MEADGATFRPPAGCDPGRSGRRRQLIERLCTMFTVRQCDKTGKWQASLDRGNYDDVDRLGILSEIRSDPSLNEHSSMLDSYKTYVNVKIKDINSIAMADSGNSSFTSINKELAAALGIESRHLEKMPGRDSIGTAKTGARMKIAGRTKNEFSIYLSPALPPIKTKLVVLPDLGMPCNISGIDLQRHKINLEVGRHLHYRGAKIPLIARQSTGPEISKCVAVSEYAVRYIVPVEQRPKAYTTTDVVVQPREIARINAIIPDGIDYIGREAFVDTSEALCDRFRIIPWRKVVVTINNICDNEEADMKSSVPIEFMNLNSHAIKIPRGTLYGELDLLTTDPPLISKCKEERVGSIGSLGQEQPSREVGMSQHEPEICFKKPKEAKTDYVIPPSPDKQSDPMAGDDVKVPEWMMGPSTPANWGQRYHYLRKLFKVDENPNLKRADERDRFLGLLLQHWLLFAWDGSYGATSLVQHYIHTPVDGKPVHDRYRPPNPVLRQSLKKQLEKWLRHGCIEPSDSQWNSNVLAVVKSNNPSAVRWCVDYRRVNAVTHIDRMPIGDVQDNLAQLGKSTLFSCLDNSGAFHTISIAPQHRHKTSFCTPFSCWQFARLPFGLSGGPSSYARLILEVLNGIPQEVAVAFVDDVLVHSATFRQHLTNLDRVFTAYGKAGLKLNPAKCKFLATEIDYLGHTVSPLGIKPQEAYLKVVKDWPIPKNRHEIMVFLGKTGYYRKFISAYSRRAKPLTELLKLEDSKPLDRTKTGGRLTSSERAAKLCENEAKVNQSSKTGKLSEAKKALIAKVILSKSQRKKRLEEPITLTREQVASFEDLKQALLSSETLGHPRFDDLVAEPYILDTDWCQETGTVAGVLSQLQIQPNGEKEERVIGYSSKKLNKSQANYSSPKGETCAVLLMINNFHFFLCIGHFFVRTDSTAAKALKTSMDPVGFMSRWQARLQQYSFTITHRAGSKHGNADSLSRIKHAEPLRDDEDVFDERTDRQYLFAIGNNTSRCSEKLCAVDESESQQMTREERWSPSYIKEIQEDDEDLSVIRSWVKKGETPPTAVRAEASRNLKTYINLYDDLELDQNEVLRYKYARSPHSEWEEPQVRSLVLLPKSALLDAVRTIHEMSAHVGVANTIDAALDNVYGLELRDAVEYVCRTCLVCQQKGGKPKKNNYSLEVPREGFPFQTLNLDIVGPLCPARKTGNSYLLTVECDFTRWVEAYPLKRATAMAVAEKLTREVFPRFGYSTFYKVDRGSHFINSIINDLMKIVAGTLLTSPAYHPQSNKIERQHRTIKSMLTSMVLGVSKGDASRWEEHLPSCLFALRCLRNRRQKYAPFELLFGTRPQTELSLIFGPVPERKDYSSERSYAMAHAHHMQQAFRWANENLTGELIRERNYYYANPKRSFALGQRVWLLTPIITPGLRKSFKSPFSGPWTVRRKINEVTYEIEPHPLWSRRKVEVVAADRLKEYVAPEDEGELAEETHPPPMSADLSLPGNEFCTKIPLQGSDEADDDDDDGGDLRDAQEPRLHQQEPALQPTPQGINQPAAGEQVRPVQQGRLHGVAPAEPPGVQRVHPCAARPEAPRVVEPEAGGEGGGPPEAQRPQGDPLPPPGFEEHEVPLEHDDPVGHPDDGEQPHVHQHRPGARPRAGALAPPVGGAPRVAGRQGAEQAPRPEGGGVDAGQGAEVRRKRKYEKRPPPPPKTLPPRHARVPGGRGARSYYQPDRRRAESESSDDGGLGRVTAIDTPPSDQAWKYCLAFRSAAEQSKQNVDSSKLTVASSKQTGIPEQPQLTPKPAGLADQSRVLQRRRALAERTDSRTLRQKIAHRNLERLRAAKLNLDTQARTLSQHRYKADNNLERLKRSSSCTSPLSVASETTTVENVNRPSSHLVDDPVHSLHSCKMRRPLRHKNCTRSQSLRLARWPAERQDGELISIPRRANSLVDKPDGSQECRQSNFVPSVRGRPRLRRHREGGSN